MRKLSLILTALIFVGCATFQPPEAPPGGVPKLKLTGTVLSPVNPAWSLSVDDIAVTDDLTVTDDATVGGDATVTGSLSAGTPIPSTSSSRCFSILYDNGTPSDNSDDIVVAAFCGSASYLTPKMSDVDFWLQASVGGDLRDIIYADADGNLLLKELNVEIEKAIINNPQRETIADSGDANPATGNIDPQKSYIEITCNDTHTCDITLQETSAIEGMTVEIVNISANTVDFADQENVLNIAGGSMAMGQDDSLTIRYTGSLWVESNRSDN